MKGLNSDYLSTFNNDTLEASLYVVKWTIKGNEQMIFMEMD